MLLGYNTNGFAHHDPAAALELLAEIGYRSVALTLDHALLNPYGEDLAGDIDRYRRLLARLGLRSVIETGARFLLDPRTKHEPTLVSPRPSSAARRVDFLRQSIDIAAALGSDCVSLWAGVLHDDAPPATAWSRLTESLGPVLEHAERRGVVVGFEPEPGMVIDTLESFGRLKQRFAERPAAADARRGALALPGRAADFRLDRSVRLGDRQRPHRGHARPASTSI